MVCHKNQWDVLHHNISPTVAWYVDGDHNVSVLNSVPIHNHGCHIGKEGFIQSKEMTRKLLNDVLHTLTTDHGYQLKQIDRNFLEIYGHLY